MQRKMFKIPLDEKRFDFDFAPYEGEWTEKIEEYIRGIYGEQKKDKKCAVIVSPSLDYILCGFYNGSIEVSDGLSYEYYNNKVLKELTCHHHIFFVDFETEERVKKAVVRVVLDRGGIKGY